MSLLKEFLDIVCRKVCRLTQEVASLLDNHGIRRHWSHWINDLCSTPNKFWTRPGPALKARHHIYHFGPKTPWIGQVRKLGIKFAYFCVSGQEKPQKHKKCSCVFFTFITRYMLKLRYFSQLFLATNPLFLATSPGNSRNESGYVFSPLRSCIFSGPLSNFLNFSGYIFVSYMMLLAILKITFKLLKIFQLSRLLGKHASTGLEP